jgi:parallel beta-helix repeat protein
MFCRRLAHLLLAILVIVPVAAAQDGHLWVGPNVNMVSGTTFPDGDPFLQRQNEPSIAVSTRDSMTLMGFVNDYRAVDIPFLIDEKTTGDAWLGVFKSFDGGQTWQSTLLRGYPQDSSPEGLASPLSNYQAGADPVVRAGTHGLFYLSGIVFDRGDPARSAVFVSRYMDLNNREGGDPIGYIDTTRVAFNNLGDYFIDKPWLAVDIPRDDPDPVSFDVYQDGVPNPIPQSIPCGNVYLAWAEIEGSSPHFRSTIRFSRSTDCGMNWNTTPIPLSNLDTMNQGVTIAVSPVDGDVWVAWRQFNTTPPCTAAVGYWKNHPEEWALKTIRLGKKKYSKAKALNILHTFPKGDATNILAHHLIAAKLNVASGVTADSLEDTIDAADDWLTDHPLGSDPNDPERQEGIDLKDLLVAHNQGVMEGCIGTGGAENAIMVVRSEDGGENFTSPYQVSTLDHFGQGTTEISFRTNSYPTMTVDDVGRAYLAWATRGLAISRPDAVEGDARIVVTTSTDGASWTTPQTIDEPGVEGHQIKPTIAFGGGEIVLAYYDLRRDFSGVFERFIADWPDLPLYRHTVDVRAAHATPADVPIFTDYTTVTGDGWPAHPSAQLSRYAFTTNESGDLELVQMNFNPPNLPIFVGGTMAFFGDYIDIVPSPPFLPDLGGGWRYNTYPEDGAVFHAVWTDNRDVEAPHDGDWTNYIPPTYDEGDTSSVFDPLNYDRPTCEPETGDEGQTRIRNQNTYTARFSEGLYVGVPGGARPLGDFQRAFVVFIRNDSYEDKIFNLTIGDLPVGVEASFDQFDLIPVTSLEVEIARYSSVARTVFVTSTDPDAAFEVVVTEVGGPDPLTRSVLVNGDPSSPAPADTELLDAENYNLSLMNRAVVNLSLMNLSLMNDPTMLSLMNLSLMNPALVSEELFNLSLMNLSLMNLSLMNPSAANLSLMNLSLMNPAIFSLSLMNPALMTSAVTNLSLMNLSLMNEDLQNLSLMNVPVDVQEATWRVRNEGTATAGYSFNMIADDVPEENFIYQLFVYRVYTVPVADGCELKEEMQHQMLVNDLDPEFLDPDDEDEIARFLDPETDDPAQSNVTFAVEAGEEVIVTLWIIDLAPPETDADDGVEFTHEDVGAAAVAHAVNTDEVGTGSGGDGEDQQPFDSDFDFGDEPLVQPLLIETVDLPDAAVGVDYSFTLTASGGLGDQTWSFLPGSTVPEGLNLDTDGNLSWTPTTADDYSFWVRVIDSTQQAASELSITVNSTTDPLILGPSPPTVTSGEPFNLPVTVRNASGDPLSNVSVTFIVDFGVKPCASSTLTGSPYTTTTDGAGQATIVDITVDGGGYGYTLVVSVNDPLVTAIAETPPFDIVGFCAGDTPGTIRYDATETVLADGRILIAGGLLGATLHSSTEIYDPASGFFAPTESMIAPRHNHTATLLPSGQVLITGGFTGTSGVVHSSAEIYDPATGHFSGAGTMGSPRARHTATLLPSGVVLIAGGLSPNQLNTAELYDPALPGFLPLSATMSTFHWGHTATLLPSGEVLLVGGVLGGADLYEPWSSSFAVTGSTGIPRRLHTATLMPSGEVLVTGGLSSGLTRVDSAEIYNRGTGAFTSTGSLGEAKAGHAATLLTSGRVLITGGDLSGGNSSSAEIYDPVAGSVSATGSMAFTRRSHMAVLLADGRVLVSGGNASGSSAELYYGPSPATFVVTNVNDSGSGSLRQAILDANNNPALDTIAFNIPGAGPHTIAPLSALPIITYPVVIDGTTQPGFAGFPVIELDGSGGGGPGLDITAGSSTVRGLVINRFPHSGISLHTRGMNRIEGNFLGTDETGTIDRGNAALGIDVGSPHNIIGGTTAAERNVISGNTGDGIGLISPSASGNVVLGNFIGIVADGSARLPNGGGGLLISSALNNRIGGTTLGSGNVISGNIGDGVRIVTGSSNNTVFGNYIGTDESGTLGLGNFGDGVQIEHESNSNVVGGILPSQANVISGNSENGVSIFESAGNTIVGNLIGTDLTGSLAIKNGLNGVYLLGGGPLTSENLISQNLISGNGRHGVSLSGGTVSGNYVQGNLIGTDASGTTDLGNTRNGVDIFSSDSNIVGGFSPLEGNVISGNNWRGIVITDSDSTLVAGNWIGTNSSMSDDLGNIFAGIEATNTSDTQIGGPGLTDGNTIAFNSGGEMVTGGAGPHIEGNVVSGNTGTGAYFLATRDGIVLSNKVGTDATGNVSLGNGSGVTLLGSATTDNVIRNNLVSGNTGVGIRLEMGAYENTVAGNTIGIKADGSAPLHNRDGVLLGGTAHTNTIGGPAPGDGNVIAGNGNRGVWITDGSEWNTIQGNSIGTDADLTPGLGNDTKGILIQGADNNLVGGTEEGESNLIAFNPSGVTVFSSSGIEVIGNVIVKNDGEGVILGSGNGNTVQGNWVGTNAALEVGLGNGGTGIAIQTADNLIGGTGVGEGNTIANNGWNGVEIRTSETGNAILSNSFFGNGALGIDLGSDGVVTPNDVGDVDSGPNGFLNFPELTSADYFEVDASILVLGTVDIGVPDTTVFVDVFVSDTCDPSGYGEGQEFLNQFVLISEPDGVADISHFIFRSGLAGKYITATTSTLLSAGGNTSEFSLCHEVQP